MFETLDLQYVDFLVEKAVDWMPVNKEVSKSYLEMIKEHTALLATMRESGADEMMKTQ